MHWGPWQRHHTPKFFEEVETALGIGQPDPKIEDSVKQERVQAAKICLLERIKAIYFDLDPQQLPIFHDVVLRAIRKKKLEGVLGVLESIRDRNEPIQTHSLQTILAVNLAS